MNDNIDINLNKQTLPEQIYRILRDDIVTQRIPCGARLTLQSLKDRFGVSHTPIREALTRLTEDDLVTYYSNIGVTVVSLGENDIREIFELSGELERAAMSCSLRGQRDAFIAELAEIVSSSDSALAAGDTEAWRALSDQFHMALYARCGNTRLEAAARKLQAQMTILCNLYQFEDRNAENIQGYHDRIYQALARGDDTSAQELLRRHLEEDMRLALSAFK